METAPEQPAKAPRPRVHKTHYVPRRKSLSWPTISGVQNNPWVRRAAFITREHINDLGGEDALSSAEHGLIRRAAVLTVELEAMEHKFAMSESGAEPADLDLYIRATGGLRRLWESLGLKRRAKDVKLIDPLEYARERHGEASE
jgi:hypothetical protein